MQEPSFSTMMTAPKSRQRVQRWLADGPGLRLDRCHCLDLKGTALVFELVYALEGSDPQAHREVQQRVALGLNRLIQELGLRLAAS